MRAPHRAIMAGITLLGAVLLIFGVAADGRLEADDLQRLGATVLILVGLVFATKRRDGMIEQARLSAYDEGFEAGATAKSAGAGVKLTLVRTSEEFGQEQAVGGVADGVNGGL